MSDYLVGLRIRSDSREVKKTEKDLGRLERQSRKTEKAAGALGKAFGRAFAGVSVGLLARQVIKNTVAQEDAVTQLNATLRSTGRYTPELSRAMQGYAQTLQDATRYGDEYTISLMAQLATFQNLGSKVLPEVTELALDFATKMGKDAKEAAVQFGRALDDPITNLTLLRRQGIAFTDAEIELIRQMQETNRLAEAQAIILDKLRDKFGGSAREARDNFGGAMAGVKNAFGDLLEVDGDSLPAVVAALNELEDVLKDPAVTEGFQKMAVGVTSLAGSIAKGMTHFVEFSEWLGEGLASVISGPASLAAVDKKIAELQQTLKLLNEEGDDVWFPGLRDFLLGGSADERRRAIEAEIAGLQELRGYYKDDDGSGDPVAPVVPDFSGLDTGLRTASIEVDEEAYEKLLKDLFKEGQETTAALNAELKNLAGNMGGETTQAALELSDTLATLQAHEDSLRHTGQLTLEAEQQLASARALAHQQYEQRIEDYEAEQAARDAQLTQAEQLLESLRFEVELIGLSNAEREKAIALRQAGADATAEERAEIEQLIQTKARAEEAQRSFNELQGALVDGLVDVGTGSKSAREAFDDFAKSVIESAIRMMAEKAVTALLSSFFGGGFGAAPGGQAGGLFGTITSGLFGPGRAAGGSVYPGRIHPVAENGPEVFTAGGDHFLIGGPRGGTVTPITKTTNNTQQTTILNVPPQQRHETYGQLASRLAREQALHRSRDR